MKNLYIIIKLVFLGSREGVFQFLVLSDQVTPVYGYP